LGYRVNTECSCTDEAGEFYLYEFGYYPGGTSGNKAPNGDFSSGLSGINLYLGADLVTLEASDRGEGSMLHLQGDAGETAAAHLANVPVSSGDSFTFTISAKIPPASRGTGYFLIIFLNSSGEITRHTIDFDSPNTLVGTAETDANGQFTYTLASPANNSTLTAAFPGDDRYLSSKDSQTILLP